VPELDVQGWDRLSVGVSATGENAATRARASRKISWSVPAVWSYDPPGYQSIGWKDLSVTNLVTSSSKHGDDDAGDRAIRSFWVTRNRVFRASATHWLSFPGRRRSLRKK